MDFGFWVQNTILRFFQVSLKSFFTTKKKEKEKEKKWGWKKNTISLQSSIMLVATSWNS